MLLAFALASASLFAATPCQDKAPPAVEFSSRITLSADVTFEDRWEHTLGSSGVKVAATKEVVRGQVFKIMVFFMNATPDADGAVEIRTDIAITRPDGKQYAEEKDIEAYTGRAAGGQVHFVRSMLAISFDPEDPAGKYRVHVVTRDVNGKKKSEGEAVIELVETIDGEEFGTGDEGLSAAMEWSTSVAAALQPHRLISAFELIAGAEHLNDGHHGTPLRTFFREAFDAHPFLYRRLGELAADKTTAKPVRDEALRILATGRTPKEKRLDVVSKEVRKACAALELKDVWNPRDDTIEDAGHLDELWATFFATGSFAPIQRITEVLDFDPKGHAGEVVMHAAARWSLDSIADQNELARSYLTWMAASSKTPDNRQAILKEILAD